jgi:hypothetical protein
MMATQTHVVRLGKKKFLLPGKHPQTFSYARTDLSPSPLLLLSTLASDDNKAGSFPLLTILRPQTRRTKLFSSGEEKL